MKSSLTRSQRSKQVQGMAILAMFTGIIQGQGEIVGLRRSGQECRMEVRPLFPLENIVDGESIAGKGISAVAL